MSSSVRHRLPQMVRIALLAAILQTLLAGVVLFVGHLYWAVSTSLGLILGA